MAKVPNTAAAAVDRAAAEEQYEAIFREMWRPLHFFIIARMEARHRPSAEDLAADTFVHLWVKYLSCGLEIHNPPGLLYKLARNRISDFYKVKANRYRETSVDFNDPANRGVEAGHSYAVEQPEAAGLARELEAAMESMTELSRKWRDRHTEANRFRSLLEGRTDAALLEHNRPKVQAKYDKVAAESNQLLSAFRRACALVGELRRDLEAAGGPNWCSSTGMPPTAARSWAKEDASQRERCSAGHELTLENTHFTEKGNRKCRTCITERCQAERAAAPPKSTAVRKSSIQPETIERARELLRNPDLSIRQVAGMVGIARSTLCERIPDMETLRDKAVKRNTPVPTAVLNRALELLTDPARPRSVNSVARELGVSQATLYTRIPNLTERCRAAREAGALASC